MGPTSTDSDFIALEWSLGIWYFQKYPLEILFAERFENHQPNSRLLKIIETNIYLMTSLPNDYYILLALSRGRIPPRSSPPMNMRIGYPTTKTHFWKARENTEISLFSKANDIPQSSITRTQSN